MEKWVIRLLNQKSFMNNELQVSLMDFLYLAKQSEITLIPRNSVMKKTWDILMFYSYFH